MARSNPEAVRLFVNPHCHYGAGLSRWEKVKDEIQRRMPIVETHEILSPEEIVSEVSRAVKNGERRFIAGGGDGTVNLLLNAIMNLSDAPDVAIGAVGLGSSNDFHKPFRPEAFINGIAARIDFRSAFRCDVIRIDYRDIGGCWRTRFCLIN